MSLNEQPQDGKELGFVKSPQDFAAGSIIVAVAIIGILGAADLSFQTSSGVGPGMMPRLAGFILAALGVVLIVNSFFTKGEGLDRWSVRNLVFVLGAALVFAWTIRPLGLVVAGPLAVIVSAFADRDTKWIEVLLFACVMTLFCIALFSWALKLPIPVWPTQLPVIPFSSTLSDFEVSPWRR